MAQNSPPPKSLIQLFDAPDNFLGFFGWVCGYSADKSFLNEAAQSFTCAPAAQRAGKISLAVLLDPTCPPVTELNGVAHLPLARLEDKPFRLLHAKVALLGFRHIEDSALWKIRVLVSTGNWTRQTVEECLDLAWSAEITGPDLDRPTAAVESRCTDIANVSDMFKRLEDYFDLRLLKAAPPDRPSEISQASRNMARLAELVEKCREHASGDGHFFDNTRQSMFDSILARVKAKGTPRRNYLAMGSGFYEGGSNKEAQIPLDIISRLNGDKLLSRSADLDLYVNPDACQSLASSFRKLRRNGFTIRPAYTNPVIFGKNCAPRFLHAKFIFSGTTERPPRGQGWSNKCKNIWLYLGSGNITSPGLMRKASPHAGNLEAGVMVFPKAMHYEYNRRNNPDWQVVDELLPVQWQDEFESANNLQAGDMEKETPQYYLAPPVACLYWIPVEDGGILIPLEAAQLRFTVLDTLNRPCEKREQGFFWPGHAPAWASITWEQDCQNLFARIPVMDEYGRIGATELPALTIEEAQDKLGAFPLPPDEEDPGDEAVDTGSARSELVTAPDNCCLQDYPTRKMMRFLELLARKQCTVDKDSWHNWCFTLEQLLAQIRGDSAVSYFREELRLNPLFPLRCQWFMPGYILNDAPMAERYKFVLANSERKWGTDRLPGLGENCSGRILD